jgi:hypothetical protein
MEGPKMLLLMFKICGVLSYAPRLVPFFNSSVTCLYIKVLSYTPTALFYSYAFLAGPILFLATGEGKGGLFHFILFKYYIYINHF